MQKSRQQDYLELAKRLLTCERDQEPEILAAHKELVDEGLVATFLSMAQGLEEQCKPEVVGTIIRLRSFAVNLAKFLEVSNEDSASQAQLEFLMTILQTVSDSSNDTQVVYPLLKQNLGLLNESLIELLQEWAREIFMESEPQRARLIAMDIGNFGNSIAKFPLGNNSINMDLAITCYKIAVEILTVDTDFEIWTTIQNNFASAYLMRIKGKRAENIELAISIYDVVLEVIDRDAWPVQWAMTQGNYASAYRERIVGNKAENLERAISSYDDALQIYTQDNFPIKWAGIQNNLALAYSDRIMGDRAENLERAISGYDASLQVYTRENFPIEWAMTQGNYASAYRERIVGNRAENLERAISGYDASLQIYTQDDFPIRWADNQNNLALTYSDRIVGERAENLERAISGYDASLQVYTRDNFPIQWAMAQSNFAIAYLYRIKGDRAENLERAISGCDAALQIYTQDDFPIDWSRTQNNRAIVYWERIKGDKEENLEKAIAGYIAALQVRNRSNFPIDWAITQGNLANAYRERIRGDKLDNLEQSIAAYEAALQVHTYDNFPIDWAAIQQNLATAYLYRIEGGKSENLELAIASCNAALQISTRTDFPINWAATHNNRANAYLYRIKGDRTENLKQAITSYKAALEIYTSQKLPIDCFQIADNLGNLHFNQGQWKQASDAYELAMTAAETSRGWVIDDDRRQEILKEALSVYENAIQCAVNLRNYPQAIQYTERVRSRQIVEIMASKDLYSNAQVPTEIKEYLQEYQQLNQDIENLQSFASVQIRQAEARKQWLYKQIRAYDPVLAGQIEIAPITHPEIQQLITNNHTAILTCYSTNDDTHIFILKANQEPELITCKGQGWNELQNWLIENWLIPYNEKDNTPWRECIPKVLRELADRLQIHQIINNHLANIQELILVPHLLLHQIPFAALPIEQGFLGERFTLRSIPSCQILQYCQQRDPITTAIQGIIEDADGTLPGARYEGHKIAEIYQVKEGDHLRGQTQATVANYRQLLGRVNRLHSSHHAASRLDNPQESAIKLADGYITLGDLLLGTRYPNLDEIFLSACETHVGNFTLTDDVTTLATGFLCIGARSVQSTLWSVSDIVTAIFDIFYHEERREGYNRAISLQRAQVRLRNLSGEEFRINYAGDLRGFLSEQLAIVSQQIAELKAEQRLIDMDREEERWNQVFEQIKQLAIEEKKLKEGFPNILKKYCEADRPFSSPYYWAGFISQGMA